MHKIKDHKFKGISLETLLKKLVSEYSFILSFLLLLIIASVVNKNFFTWTNLTNIFVQSSMIGLISMGMSMVISAGLIDISVGSQVALIGGFGILVLNQTASLFLMVVFCCIFGILIGTVNGLLTTKGGMPAMVATMAIAIGVTIPGLADPKEGIWIEASFSGIRNINIRHLLESEFGIAVYIDNDAQACALAEKLFGSCKSTKNFIYMTISNGVGGALFINDDLYYGGFGNAGEIGHCIVVEDGNQCNCGNKGCLEMHASGPALVRNYIELGGSSRYFGKLIDAKNIAELAYKGDEIAIRTFELEGYYLGKIIALISNVINPEKVIIGGGVSLSFSLFEKSLKETLRNHIYLSANKNLEISPSQFGSNGGIFGATAIAICGKDNKYNWGVS